jgi:chromate transporter
LGAPYIEQLRGNRRVGSTLNAVTAAVVGVILNLAVWFGRQVFFPEDLAHEPHVHPDWFSIGLAALAFAALQWRKADVLLVILGCGGLGLIWSLV